MAEYVNRNDVCFHCSYDGDCIGSGSECERCTDNVIDYQDFMEIPTANAVDREKILNFLEDNRPTDIQTDWERGCAYICDEIEKLLK